MHSQNTGNVLCSGVLGGELCSIACRGVAVTSIFELDESRTKLWI